MINQGHTVELIRAIIRSEDAFYAAAGEQGVVKEVFRPKSQSGGVSKDTPWCAKVKMDRDGKIRTFRLTSLKKVSG